MKRFGIILGFALLFVGCQRDFTADNTVGGGNTLTVSISKTRTSMGGKVGDTHPVYWSERDKIVVNGVLSNEAQIDADEPATATFKFDSNIAYPYNITYPYCEVTSAEQPIVEFATEQNYIEGSFASGCAPMCGYATNGNNIAIKHLASVMRIPVKSAVVTMLKPSLTATFAIGLPILSFTYPYIVLAISVSCSTLSGSNPLFMPFLKLSALNS